ncbi:uncharacterized protein LOC134193482 [Corticium candelabrum]|uniref:uncharacterized protein LOC134193482 n=1 Tax=Corticium candelabrum TaxID=121492 RepID=UPI002E25D685|nr:uncharacterized protein LOC134193482 [Corticium candelabrum]
MAKRTNLWFLSVPVNSFDKARKRQFPSRLTASLIWGEMSVEGTTLSTSVQCLGSCGTAAHNDTQALEELLQRHPQHVLPDWNDDIPPPLTVSSESVLSALHDFPKASSPGASQLHCQHLLDATDGNSSPLSKDCLDRLTRLICFLLSGQADSRIAPWLSGAPLTALLKKQGGIRPIAVGEVLRRLTSRLCCSAARSASSDVFLPYGQVGVGIRGGLEAAVHSLSAIIDLRGNNPDLCCLKVDFRNAFNECRRSSFLHRLQRDFPSIFAWAQWCYHCEGQLRFGSHCIKSSGGVQQGDPLGPLLFSLTLLELLDDIDSTPDINLQVWYLDDGTIVGPRKAVSSLLDSLSVKGPSHGLILNLEKCEVFWPSGDISFPEFPDSVQRVQCISGGAEFLGSPVFGSDAFYDATFGRKIDKILSCQSRLTDLEDPQVELHLLRSCLSLCKVNHLLRTVPSEKVKFQLERFDSELRSSLEVISRSSVSDVAWKQATLPIRLGGLGLRETCRTSALAFVGSCNFTRDLSIRLLGCTKPPVLRSSEGPITNPDVPDLLFPGEVSSREQLLSTLLSTADVDLGGASQHDLQEIFDKSLLSDIKNSVSIRDQARLNAISTPHAGAWLRAIPNRNLGLVMSAEEYVIALRLRLGIPIFPSLSTRCPCGSIIDAYGDHVLGCGYGNLRIKRHDALRDVIFHTLLEDHSGTRREQHCGGYNNSRPGDVYHPDFLLGRPGYFDITVRNSFQQSHIVHSAYCAGAAAAAGEMEKDDRHKDNVEATGGVFYPLVVESYGTWTSSSLQTLKTIARRTSLRSSITVSRAIVNFHGQLSLRLWQFNARMILDRLSLLGLDRDYSVCSSL